MLTPKRLDLPGGGGVPLRLGERGCADPPFRGTDAFCGAQRRRLAQGWRRGAPGGQRGLCIRFGVSTLRWARHARRPRELMAQRKAKRKDGLLTATHAVSVMRVRYCPADRVFLSGRGFPALFRRHGPIFPADRSRCDWWDSPTGLGIAVPARASQPNGGTRASKQISSAVVTRCEGNECGETEKRWDFDPFWSRGGARGWARRSPGGGCPGP